MSELKQHRPITLYVDNAKKGTLKLPHEKTDEVLYYVHSKIPVLMVGPAGSGKTHIAVSCAKLLDVPCYSISVNEQTSKSDFLGYTDANGQIVKTNFRKAYEEGGVFVIDEIDAGNPNILTVINSALSNDMCPFPYGMVDKHKDFVCICTANTFGEGESLQYIGRNILDAATRDRFATIFISYSDYIEKTMIPTYRNLLVELRNHFTAKNANVVISTRAGIRLERLSSAKKEKLTAHDIVACLNLHQEMGKDSTVVSMVKKYV